MNSSDTHTDEGNAVPEVLVTEMSQAVQVADKQTQAYCVTNPETDTALINAQTGLLKARLLMLATSFIGVFALIMSLFSIWLLLYPELYGHEPNLSESGVDFLTTMKEVVSMFFKVLS